MFSTMQTTGMKRSREVDAEDAQQLHSHSIERRIARMRDNSINATFAASNISENSISSSTLFLPSHERSSPPRARSNALSISHTVTTMTPYPSDTEDLNFTKHGIVKVPTPSLRSPKAPTNALSTAQSPAESFHNCSQYEEEDRQDTSMITEYNQDDSLVDLEMDDAPAFSLETSFSFKPPTVLTANPLLGAGASISEATNLLQTSGRLPSPADSDNDGHDQSLITELENSSMGMQLQGAQQDGQGKWRIPSGSRNMGHVADGMHLGKGGSKPRVSMGFRADCEKCIQRVPGHYMHIL